MIQNEISAVQYPGNGSATQFAFPNKVFDATELLVTLINNATAAPTTVTPTAVSGIDNDNGVTVTVMPAPPAGYTLDIRTQTSMEQLTSIKNQGKFLPELHEEAFDKLTREVQDVFRQAVTFGLHAPDNETVAWPPAPPIASRKGQAMMYDASTGLPTVGVPVTQTLTQGLIGELLYPQTAQEITAGVTPVYYYCPPGDLRRYGAVGDGVTDDTLAIQNAFNVRGPIYIRSGGKFMFTNLIVRIRTVITGDGPRQSVLRQIPGTTGWALTFETGNPPAGSGAAAGDISEGGYVFENWGLEVSAANNVIGLKFGDGTTGEMSEFRTSSFRLENQFSETLGSPPFATPTGAVGIYLNATGGGTSIYAHSHRNLEIRSFESAVYARGGVNDHVYHGWFINCLYGFNLNTCSTWRFNVSHETHVLNARGWYLGGSISNFQIEGGRWEMPVAGCYGIEFLGGLVGTNFRVNNPNVLITGDGSAIPGQKWTGTPLPDSLMTFYDAAITGPAIIVPGKNQMRLPNSAFFGGLNIGNATIQLGRNAGGADGFLQHDGSNILLIGGNNLRLSGGGTTNQKVEVNNTGVGFQGTAPIAKPAVTGAKGGNAALTSLLTTLASYGLITDSTT